MMVMLIVAAGHPPIGGLIAAKTYRNRKIALIALISCEFFLITIITNLKSKIKGVDCGESTPQICQPIPDPPYSGRNDE